MFYGQYAIAGAFGGLVSYCVFSLFPSDPESEAEHQGWYSYQVLFLVEGAFTVVIAVITLFWLSSGPDRAWWLDVEEREWAAKRVLLDRSGVEGRGSRREEEEGLLGEGMEVEVGVGGVGGEPGLTKRDVVEAVRDWKVWWVLGVNVCSSVPGMAFSVFLPLVVKVSGGVFGEGPGLMLVGYGVFCASCEPSNYPAVPLWRGYALGNVVFE